MARVLIREAHGGATRVIGDAALPYFLNSGWVIIDTQDDSTDASPLYLSKVESDLRYALKGQAGGSGADDTSIAALVGSSTSQTGTALRTASVAAVTDSGQFSTAAASAARALVNAEAATVAARLQSLFLGPGTGVFISASAPTANRLSTTLAAAASSGATSLSLAAQLTPGTYVVDAETVTVTAVTGSAAPYAATLATATTAAHASGAAIATTALDYSFIHGIGGGRFVRWTLPYLTNNPPAYTYGLNQLHNCDVTLAQVSVGMESGAIVRAGTWTATNPQAAAYGGSYRYSSTANSTATWTTPAGTTSVGWRGVTTGNGGIAKVTIDGDTNLANRCPTAQSLVTAGYPAGILVANGGTLNPTDRVLTCYAGPLTYDTTKVLADGLTAGTHTVVITATGYGQAALTGGRTYVAGLASGSASTTPTDSGANLFSLAELTNSATVSSAWEYADEERPTGTGTLTFVGNIHGYEKQNSLTIYLAGDAAAPTTMTAGQTLAPSRGTVKLVRTSTLFHPDGGTAPTKTSTVTYQLDRLGLLVTSAIAYQRAMECDLAYAMMPANGTAAVAPAVAFDRGGLSNMSGALSFPGSSDTRYGYSQSSAAWLWSSVDKWGMLMLLPDYYGFTDGHDHDANTWSSIQDRAGALTKVYMAWIGSSGGSKTIPSGITKQRSARYLVGYFSGGAEGILAIA